MTPEQALNILIQTSSMAPIIWEHQLQRLKAVDVIKKLIEDQTNGSDKKS